MQCYMNWHRFSFFCTINLSYFFSLFIFLAICFNLQALYLVDFKLLEVICIASSQNVRENQKLLMILQNGSLTDLHFMKYNICCCAIKKNAMIVWSDQCYNYEFDKLLLNMNVLIAELLQYKQIHVILERSYLKVMVVLHGVY